MDENSISVIIAALNEEKNLEATVVTALEAVKKAFAEYEIIIVDDGSTDSTGEIAEKIRHRNKNVRVIHNKRSKCLGGVFKEGLKLARMHYVMLINGKNDTTVEGLTMIFSLRGRYDIIIPYTINTYERPALRRVISRAFTRLLNMLFGLHIAYYNHYCLHKRALVNSIDIKTSSYAFQAEILVKLIKAGYSYKEVVHIDKFDQGVKTKAFSIHNISSVAVFFPRLLMDIFITKSHLKMANGR